MEERIIDKEDEKTIRLKKTKEGEMDAVDELTADGEQEEASEEEVVLSVPEDDEEDDEEYDEDLVGLTPSQLEAELARRKKMEEAAHKEFDALVESANAALEKGDYEGALPYLEQATCYAFSDEKTECDLWIARTKNFTDDAPFYNEEYTEEFLELSDGAKAFVREKVGERLKKEQDEAKKEAEEIAPHVLEKQEERRQAFRDNRSYYVPYLLAFAGMVALFLVGAGISAAFIVKTPGILPVVFVGVCGGIALVFLAVFLVYLRKWLVANRLCRANENLSSTQEGERLETLQNKIAAIDVILNG